MRARSRPGHTNHISCARGVPILTLHLQLGWLVASRTYDGVAFRDGTSAHWIRPWLHCLKAFATPTSVLIQKLRGLNINGRLKRTIAGILGSLAVAGGCFASYESIQSTYVMAVSGQPVLSWWFSELLG